MYVHLNLENSKKIHSYILQIISQISPQFDSSTEVKIAITKFKVVYLRVSEIVLQNKYKKKFEQNENVKKLKKLTSTLH